MIFNKMIFNQIVASVNILCLKVIIWFTLMVMFIYAFLHGHNVAEFGMALISHGMAGIFFEEWHGLSK